MKLHSAPFISLVDSGSVKTSPRPTPTHLLAARTPVHEDGGRDHDAPLENLVLCDTGCNRSWSRCTRCCEVVRIGDRDYADQIRVIQVDENPMLGDRAVGYTVTSSLPTPYHAHQQMDVNRLQDVFVCITRAPHASHA